MHDLTPIINAYLDRIRAQHLQSNSTAELSYRTTLETFLNEAASALGKSATFTNEPKARIYGRPDFEASHGLKVIGYAEAEALGTPLSQLAGHAKEQNERFRKNLHNFLLTNHTEFRLYVDDREAAIAYLPEPSEQGNTVVPPSAVSKLQALLEQFLDGTTPFAATPEAIARQLARRARFLRVAAEKMLNEEDSPLLSLWNMYRQTLFDGIEKEKFADVYAQTFTYGLFLAWLNTTGMIFDRPTALHGLPRAVPPMRVLLTLGGGDDLPDPLIWIVDGICADLEAADRAAAMKHGAGIADPLVHFYETFLAAYDPQLRERAGVYYTPDPVVDFIVRAVDDVLKRDFGKIEGLADQSVRLLDPATGTGTFLARAYRQVHETMLANGEGGLWPDQAKNHLAKHFYGFERLPAAYTLAHVKLRQLFSEFAVPLPDSVRIPVYLADTMMNKAPEQHPFPGADILSREIRDAIKVRDQEEILVVIGNPPYFGKSDNPSKDASGHLTFIGKLIQTYYSVDGIPLGEKNPKWLQNDYVKFLRFAQWKIEQSGQGIVAFITDNSYLDNPTFRGMRRSLMQTFDAIYLLDLHGNSKKKERAQDGTKDENVFDITQGVAIALFIRRPSGGDAKREEAIYHANLYGTRQKKYGTLLSSEWKDISWEGLSPNAPFYLFKPQEQGLREEYERGWSITDIFPINVLGFQTHRDNFAIDFDGDVLKQRIADFMQVEADIARQRYNLGSWDVAKAKTKLLSLPNWETEIRQCLYRPFDTRPCFYHNAIVDRPRVAFIRHVMDQPNMVLLASRQQALEGFRHIFIANTPPNDCVMSTTTREANQAFPLWLYPDTKGLGLYDERQPNLNSAFVMALTERVGDTPTPEAIFYYAYAVFHAPTYRNRYAPFLKIDFPRLPLPSDSIVFNTFAALGERLAGLHLLESPELTPSGIGFPIAGDHRVKKMRIAERYIPPRSDGTPGQVRLNDAEVFDNVPPEAWEFRVGGYQPAYKWLDDRVDRYLTEEDITHYRKMLASMRETARLLPEVDAAFRTMLGLESVADD